MAGESRRRKSSMSWGTHAECFAHQRERWFSICNVRTRTLNASCSPLPSFVFGVKAPPSQKSQILYDTVEIALSKMQSAKAASSADELPWLRERQWHVSFAATGSTEDKNSESRNASFTWINILQVRSPKHPQRYERYCPMNRFVLPFSQPLHLTLKGFEWLLKNRIQSVQGENKKKIKACIIHTISSISLFSSFLYPPSVLLHTVEEHLFHLQQ